MENKLVTIVQESGLEKSKADFLLKNFQNYFEIAAEWEKKAMVIKVTDKNQIAEMKMAREGRLFLKEKRLAIEKARKELKEQSLREGRAIDGIANVLKALIVPIEEYLLNQEKFVEIQAELKRQAIEEEERKKLEEARLKKEEEERKEQERIRKENDKLKKEAEIKEAKQKKIDEAKEKEIAKAKKIAEKAEAKRLQAEKELAKKKRKEEAEKKAKAEAEAKAKSAPDKEKLEKLADSFLKIEMPEVQGGGAKVIILRTREYLLKLNKYIKNEAEKL